MSQLFQLQHAASMASEAAEQIVRLRESLLPLVPFPEGQMAHGVFQILAEYGTRMHELGCRSVPDLVAFGFAVNSKVAAITNERSGKVIV